MPHKSYPIAVLFIFIFLALSLRSTQAQTILKAEDRGRLFLQALSIFPDRKIPAEYRRRVAEVTPPRCGTMTLAIVQTNFDFFTVKEQIILHNLLDRPQLPLSYISTSGRFKIHYTNEVFDAVPRGDANNNGVPDFVEDVAGAFDLSHQIQVDDLQYREPPDDGGVDGPEYDVYIQDQFNLYGFTRSEGVSGGGFQTFIVIDNNFMDGHFTTGLDGAQVTAAHEYFHAVQFGYRVPLTLDEPFYFEISSVWMEEVVYDGINDYFQYLPLFFSRTNIPFNQFDQFFHAYGEALWNLFLVKKFDDATVIRRTWEIMDKGSLAIHAIDEALNEEHNTSFGQEFAEFAIWNYFTGSRADAANFYDDSAEYPEIKINDEFEVVASVTVSDSSKSLTHKYFRITTRVAGEFSISGKVLEPANWIFATLTIDPSGNRNFYVFLPFSGKNLGHLPDSSQIIVIPVNLKTLDGPDLPQLDNTYLSFEFTVANKQIELPGGRGILALYPLPLVIGQDEQKIIVEFSAGERTDIQIFSSDGRLIKRDRTDSEFYFWDGKSDRGEIVPSGIYLFHIKQGSFMDVKKFAVIRQ